MSETVQNIGEVEEAEKLLHEQLRFERLLSSLSASFINLPVSEVDTEIEVSLKLLVEFLGFDRSIIMEFSKDMERLHVAHQYERPGIPMFEINVLPNSTFKWYIR